MSADATLAEILHHVKTLTSVLVQHAKTVPACDVIPGDTFGENEVLSVTCDAGIAAIKVKSSIHKIVFTSVIKYKVNDEIEVRRKGAPPFIAQPREAST